MPALFAQPPADLPDPGEAVEIHGFGSNPGKLAMLVHAPSVAPAPGGPLVVLLHGCGQGAVRFAADSGWVALADRLGFPLLLPEQAQHNNQGRCFNWFRPGHVGRDQGEAASIRQMVDDAVRRYACDERRVFIVGLSAGGAMTAAMLAAYPDVFAAGAAVAGLPVGAATGPAQALGRMSRAGPERSPAEWADQVRAAAPAGYSGPWPRLSVWTGEADQVVDPANARLLVEQWSELHGHGAPSWSEADVAPARREVWGPVDRPGVELWTVPGLAHGYPIDGTAGHASTYVPDVGLSATARIARFWGIA
jgi:poly(hydroxyalkanoate) depolymerase family esterase